MEYTQWVNEQINLLSNSNSLNPCCNGIYSMRPVTWGYVRLQVLILVVMEYTQWDVTTTRYLGLCCLNPCCNGIYSMSVWHETITHYLEVLILVVMEYTQWEMDINEIFTSFKKVLILVVMEYTQWVNVNVNIKKSKES